MPIAPVKVSEEKFISTFSKKTPETWTKWRRSNFDFFTNKLQNLPRSSKLIDLGAGALHFEQLFLQFDYVGVDFMSYPHVSIVADLTKKIPLPDESADIVVASNTVEHIPNTEHFIKECARLLRREGILVGTIPFLTPIHQEPYDFNRYTKYQLEKFLSEAGFHNIEVVPLGSQIDVYNTIELKTFDELYKRNPKSFLLKAFRIWRRFEMRIIRLCFSHIPSSAKVTEGYGFCGTK